MELNVLHCVSLTKLVLPRMQEQRKCTSHRATIAVTSSLSGKLPVLLLYLLLSFDPTSAICVFDICVNIFGMHVFIFVTRPLETARTA